MQRGAHAAAYGFERVQGPKKLLVTHPSGFAEAQMYYFDEQFHRDELLPWYDHHLKGIENGVMKQPAARFYVDGEETYRSAETWPPPDARPTTFYLSSAHSGAVTSLNDGSLAETASDREQDSTSWSCPDPEWMAGVTVFDSRGARPLSCGSTPSPPRRWTPTASSPTTAS